MIGFGLPRFFACVAALSLLLAVVYTASGWYGRPSITGCLCTAIAAAWMSHATSTEVRERRAADRAARRRAAHAQKVFEQLERVEQGEVSIASIEVFGRRFDLHPLNDRLQEAS